MSSPSLRDTTGETPSLFLSLCVIFFQEISVKTHCQVRHKEAKHTHTPLTLRGKLAHTGKIAETHIWSTPHVDSGEVRHPIVKQGTRILHERRENRGDTITAVILYTLDSVVLITATTYVYCCASE
jgi:hypothetical protein